MNRFLTTIIITLMMFSYVLGNSSTARTDGFRAEGLTEPVDKGDRDFAVKITFPHDDFYMIFDPPGKAGYFTPEGIGFSNEWAETASVEEEHPGWGEVLFDRNAVMWVERQSPARKVVRFRGALKTPEGEILHTYVDSGSPYGEGDWSDEWFYIYPDGVSVRVVKIYTGKTEDAVAFWGLPGYAAFWGIRGTVFETQETFIHGVAGLQPPDIIETEALTLITMDGQYKRISYKRYPPDRSLFDPANIQMVNLKSKYHPFTIVTEGNVEIKPYYMPMDDHRNIDKTVFITWPRRGHFEDGDYTSALSHVIKWRWHEKTENTLVQVYLLGMTDEPTEQQRVDKLVDLAKSWQYAPELVLRGGGYRYDGYELKEKAYVLTSTSKQKDLHVCFRASSERPLVSPVFAIKGMDSGMPVKLMVDGVEVSNYRAGIEGDNILIWVPLTSMRDTSLKLLF
ncbi:MAG: hypothetical protein JSU59_08410 [Nitrospirota bacterium]|nr:MAG: hypothetical protein JSU59_08410 [Nitrospirota bacterium]